MFSTLSKTEIIIYVTFILSSANAFILDKVNFLSSGNGLSDVQAVCQQIKKKTGKIMVIRICSFSHKVLKSIVCQSR